MQFDRVATKTDLKDTVSMKRPHLVILEKIGDCPVKGGCSSCDGVIFQTGTGIGVAAEHHAKLDSLFREHFRKIHRRRVPDKPLLGS